MRGDIEIDGAIYGRTRELSLLFIYAPVATISLFFNNEIVEYTPLPFLQSPKALETPSPLPPTTALFISYIGIGST